MKFRYAAIAGILLFSFSPGLAGAADSKQQIVNLASDGDRALKQRRYADARKDLEAALLIDCNCQEARQNLALAYSFLGEAAKTPLDAMAYHCLALNWQRIGEKGGSESNSQIRSAAILRDIELSEKLALNSSNAGNSSRFGDLELALLKYQKSLTVNDDAAIRERLGDVYRLRKQDDLAVSEFLAGIQLKPSLGLWLKMSQALQAVGKNQLAELAYERAESFPSKTEAESAMLREFRLERRR